MFQELGETSRWGPVRYTQILRVGNLREIMVKIAHPGNLASPVRASLAKPKVKARRRWAELAAFRERTSTALKPIKPKSKFFKTLCQRGQCEANKLYNQEKEIQAGP